MRKRESDPDRWIGLPKFLEDEDLSPDDLLRLAEADRLPPHAWVGNACLVDRSKRFSWRQLVELDGLIPLASAEMRA